MSAAGPDESRAILFFLGILLNLAFSARVFVRVYQYMQALGYSSTTDVMGVLFSRIRLKDTLVRDVAGCLLGVVITIVALQYL